MRILLVVNSFASSVTARNTVVVHRRLAQGHDVEVVETNRRGHATRFAHDAARRGVDVVIGYGGDGTLNEVATGIAGSDTALGVLPGGSTNVFARTLGMPNDPVAAADLLAGGIDAGNFRPIGLGRVNGRFFCFHTGIGFDAAVVRAVEQHASVKRWLGHPLFISAGLTTWLRGYDRSEPHFRVERLDAGKQASGDPADDEVPAPPTDAAIGDVTNHVTDHVIEDGFFSIVLNTNPYTYLGNRPLDLSPAATLERGLVVLTFRTLRVLPILRGLGSALRGGGVTPSEHLAEWRDVDRFVVEHAEPFPYQVDGDYLGSVNRLEFDHIPNAVRLVFPTSDPST